MLGREARNGEVVHSPQNLNSQLLRWKLERALRHMSKLSVKELLCYRTMSLMVFKIYSTASGPSQWYPTRRTKTMKSWCKIHSDRLIRTSCGAYVVMRQKERIHQNDSTLFMAMQWYRRPLLCKCSADISRRMYPIVYRYSQSESKYILSKHLLLMLNRNAGTVGNSLRQVGKQSHDTRLSRWILDFFFHCIYFHSSNENIFQI